jgi:hypothetical protein
VGAGMIPEYTLARKEFSEITRRARALAKAVQRARRQVAQPAQPVRPIEGPDIR